MRRHVLLPGGPLLYYGLAAGFRSVPLRAAGRLLKRRLPGTRGLGRTSGLLGRHGAVVLLRSARARLPRLVLGGGKSMARCFFLRYGRLPPGRVLFGMGRAGRRSLLTGRHGTAVLLRNVWVHLPRLFLRGARGRSGHVCL